MKKPKAEPTPEQEVVYTTFLMPPPSLRREFMRVAARAPEGVISVQREDDLHITLNQFKMPRKGSKTLVSAKLATIEFPPFDIRITDADVFYRSPPQHESHVAWLRPDGLSSFDIQDLHARIHLLLRGNGYTAGPAEMEFRPHMTLLHHSFNAAARSFRSFLKQAAGHNYPVWPVDRFFFAKKLFMDHPKHPANNGDKGSKYEIIGTFPLKAL